MPSQTVSHCVTLCHTVGCTPPTGISNVGKLKTFPCAFETRMGVLRCLPLNNSRIGPFVPRNVKGFQPEILIFKSWVRQQVANLTSIDSQLDRFGAEMKADSEAQRVAMRDLLQGQSSRAEEAVGDVLQLSKISGLTGYIFGGKAEDISDMPMARVRFMHSLLHSACSMLQLLVRAAARGGPLLFGAPLLGCAQDLSNAQCRGTIAPLAPALGLT
jgi:hypothetical protein